MHVITGFVDVNDTRLYYEVAGSDQPLVLIHGFTLDTRMWDDQFEAFARQFQVIRYDLCGFGQSSIPTGAAYQHEADLRALLSCLDIESAHLIGLSLGGMIAIDFALTYPLVVRSLIVVDALYSGSHWSSDGTVGINRIWEIAHEQDIAAAKQSWLDHPLFQPAHKQPETYARLAQMVLDYSGWNFAHDNSALSLTPPAVERLAQIMPHTLIVIGERDLPDFQHMASDLEREIPNSRKVMLPNIGHMANMEDPSGFNAVVLEFLTNVS